MRLATLALSAGAALIAALLAWNLQAQERAQLHMQVLAARAEPLGQLTVEGLHVRPWQPGRAGPVRLVLSPEAAGALGLAADSVLAAEQVELLHYRESALGVPQELRLRWRDLRWPLPAGLLSGGALTALNAEGELSFIHWPGSGLIELALRVSDPAAGQLSAGLKLRGGQSPFTAALDDIALRGAEFDYQDFGLWPVARQSLVRQLGAAGEAALAEVLRESFGLSPPAVSVESAAAWHRFFFDGERLQLSLVPPGQPRWRDLPLYERRDLPLLLGLSASVPDRPAAENAR